MSSLNKVTLIGNVGKAIEEHTTSGGHKVAVMSIATTERWSSDSKTKSQTEWHRVVLWDRLAEIAARHLAKGNRVFVEGRIQSRPWQDSAGNRRTTVEIVASELRFLDGARRPEIA